MPVQPIHLHREDFLNDINLPLNVFRKEPQEPFPLHSHDFSELVIVLGGTGVHRVLDDEFPIGPGDTFVIKTGQVHEYFEVKDLVLINIQFDLKKLDIAVDDLSTVGGYHALFTVEPAYRREDGLHNQLTLDRDQLAYVEKLVSDIEAELTAKTPGYVSLCKSYFMTLVVFISRCYSGESTFYSNKILKIGEAISYIEENYSDNISINDLVRITRLSKSTLLRSFKKCFNMSPISYINATRINKACRLLKTTDYSITDIALMAGFSDSIYFAKKFKSLKKSTPGRFRAINRVP